MKTQHARFRISFLLVILFEKCSSENLELLILHNNDMHARFEESGQMWKCRPEDGGNCYGGFARTAHVVREARKAAKDGKGPNVLFLNAGDTYTGTPWFSVHKWRIVADFLNLLHPDAASFGNHEFDERVDGLTPFLNAASFPIVASNLDFSKEPKLQATNVTKSVILEVAGRKIGVIGYLTPDTVHISAPEKVIFRDEVASIKEESVQLDKQGVKIIIALGHSGYEMDKNIAKEVPLVDLVVGGHTNTFLWNGPKPDAEEPQGPYPTVIEQSSGKKVPVVQAYAHTKYMGRLNIVFDNQGNVVDFSGLPILLNNKIPQEQDFLELVKKYKPEVEKLMEETNVGRTKVTLDGRAESCRYRECNFGNLITDAFVAYHSARYNGSYWTDAPVAVINGGAIRNEIVPTLGGIITMGELLGAMPFGDQIFSVSLKGSDLLETLEHGVKRGGNEFPGEFMQVSGIHYRFDSSKSVGSRITQAKARCGLCSVPKYEPIDRQKSYRIITTGFLSNGGDKHTTIRDKGYDWVMEEQNDLEIVAWYIKSLSFIYPGEEERIIKEINIDGMERDVGKGRGAKIEALSVLFMASVVLVLNFVKFCF